MIGGEREQRGAEVNERPKLPTTRTELWVKPFAKGLRRAREAEPLGQGAKATRQPCIK